MGEGPRPRSLLALSEKMRPVTLLKGEEAEGAKAQGAGALASPWSIVGIVRGDETISSCSRATMKLLQGGMGASGCCW